MRKLIVVLTTVLAGASACKDTTDTTRPEDEFRKPLEGVTEPIPNPTDHDVPATATEQPDPWDTDDDFAQTRKTYSTHVKTRLDRLDSRIRELEARTDEAAAQTAATLRARRDQLARRIDTIATQAKAGWDQFETDMSRTFSELEREVDAAVR